VWQYRLITTFLPQCHPTCFYEIFTFVTWRLDCTMLILSLFYPHFFHNYDIDVKPTYFIHSLDFFLYFMNKLYPTIFLKVSTLFNKKHHIFFSQVFQVINKKYLTFLKCFSCYLRKSNPIFFIANNKYSTIFLAFSTLFNNKHYTLYSNFFHLI